MLESVFIRRFKYICLFPFVSFPVPVSWNELYYETREDTQLWAEIRTIPFPSLRSMVPSAFRSRTRCDTVATFRPKMPE